MLLKDERHRVYLYARSVNLYHGLRGRTYEEERNPGREPSCPILKLLVEYMSDKQNSDQCLSGPFSQSVMQSHIYAKYTLLPVSSTAIIFCFFALPKSST